MVRGDPPVLLIAVNPFKGTLSARAVGAACRRAAEATGWHAQVLAGSDGGDGLLEALRDAGLIARETRHRTVGPRAERIEVGVGWLGDGGAVVESRDVVGLALVPPAERDPGRRTTRGLGRLLREVIELGPPALYVGLGGSATMDGGVGMAAELGWRLRDVEGGTVACGNDLMRLVRVEGAVTSRVPVVALHDVDNALRGPGGAMTYAAQKGASEDAARALAKGLDRLVDVLGPEAARVAEEPGTGAAGGLGFGLRWFAGARLERGAAWVLRRTGFERLLDRADAVLTAEGAFDATSRAGKLPGEVIRAASARGLPVGLLAPRAADVPPGVAVETADGVWDEETVAQRAAALLARLPPPPA